MKTRSYRWQVRFVFVLLGITAGTLAAYLSVNHQVAEGLHLHYLSGTAAALSRLSSLAPVAIAEILLGLFVLRQLLRIGQTVYTIRKKRLAASRGIFRAVLGFSAEAGIIVTLFYALWGFNYFRPPMETRLAWEGLDADLSEVEQLSREMVAEVNAAYLVLHGTDDVGRPTSDPRSLLELAPFLEEGYRQIRASLGEPAGKQVEFGPPKPLWIGPALHFFGLSGFYFPWTGEACVNPGVPVWQLPLVMAHEMAHQRGFGPEDEANFVGYLVCEHAEDPLVRYGAALFAQRQLLSVLRRSDETLWSEIAAKRLPGVLRDLEAEAGYWRRFEEGSALTRKMNVIARGAAERVNDAYLRTHQVEGGVASYSRSVRLLIAFRRSLRSPGDPGEGQPPLPRAAVSPPGSR